jgi:hypothetical protein
MEKRKVLGVSKESHQGVSSPEKWAYGHPRPLGRMIAWTPWVSTHPFLICDKKSLAWIAELREGNTVAAVVRVQNESIRV